MQKRFFIIIFLGMVFIFNGAAFALSHNPPKPDVVFSEQNHIRILFLQNGRTHHLMDERGKKEKWVEVTYKFVAVDEKGLDLFSQTGWVKVNLLDAENFELVEDGVRKEDLYADREYFGSVWIPERKAKQLVRGSAASVKEDRIKKIMERNEKNRLMIEGVDAQPSLRLKELQAPKQAAHETPIAPEGLSAQAVKPEPPKKLTNEDVEELLKAFDEEVERQTQQVLKETGAIKDDSSEEISEEVIEESSEESEEIIEEPIEAAEQPVSEG